jgi:hypothetical protein
MEARIGLSRSEEAYRMPRCKDEHHAWGVERYERGTTHGEVNNKLAMVISIGAPPEVRRRVSVLSRVQPRSSFVGYAERVQASSAQAKGSPQARPREGGELLRARQHYLGRPFIPH